MTKSAKMVDDDMLNIAPSEWAEDQCVDFVESIRALSTQVRSKMNPIELLTLVHCVTRPLVRVFNGAIETGNGAKLASNFLRGQRVGHFKATLGYGERQIGRTRSSKASRG